MKAKGGILLVVLCMDIFISIFFIYLMYKSIFTDIVFNTTHYGSWLIIVYLIMKYDRKEYIEGDTE